MRKLLLLLFTVISMATMAENINIGYKRTETYFYGYDGFGNMSSTDIKMGGAILISASMYKDYIGAKIIGVRVGWSNPNATSSATIFLRKNLTDKENILSGSGTLKYKALSGMDWMSDYSYINYDNPDGLTLTADMGDFYVGFYADKVKAGTYAFGTSYPANQAGSAYIWGDVEGENYDKNGNELWVDGSQASALCLDLIVQGTFEDNVQIVSFLTYPSMLQGETDEALITFRNNGTNPISQITLKYDCRGESKTEDLEFLNAINGGDSKTAVVPAYAMGSGKNTVTITRLNGNAVTDGSQQIFRTIAVPASVAKEYTRTSLVEFFQSENSYYVPRYYEQLIMPGYEPYADRLNIVAQHVNDQWMTGDDEETQLMVDMADGNRGCISIPAMSVDRAPNIGLYSMNVDRDAPFHGVIYPRFAEVMYDVALNRPTYVSVKADCEVQGEQLNVTITGDIAQGITGEQLYMTAYLLEDDVYTDSQEQNELEKGDYYHDNLQRTRLTALWGDPIPVTSGAFEMKYTTDLYPDEWKLKDMRIVAMVNRGVEGNDMWNRDILNSTSCYLIPRTDAITTLGEKRPTGRIYDLEGRRVLTPRPGGLYIMDGKKVKL